MASSTRLDWKKNLSFHIDPEAKNLAYAHYFRLNVYDRITDIEYPVNTTH